MYRRSQGLWFEHQTYRASKYSNQRQEFAGQKLVTDHHQSSAVVRIESAIESVRFKYQSLQFYSNPRLSTAVVG